MWVLYHQAPFTGVRWGMQGGGLKVDGQVGLGLALGFGVTVEGFGMYRL